MKQPLVSIIMPAYRQAEYIAEALESVKKQTYGNWEIIIVDDGSPDNVAKIADNYSREDTRIKFFHTDNKGVSAARNFAVERAAGEYILPLDADDTIEPTYVEKCVQHFSAHPETDVVYCRWRCFGETKKTPKLEYVDYETLLLSNRIFVSAMFRKSRFEEIGGYDEEMRQGMEDWEFWIRFLDRDSVVFQIPEQLFNYRIKAVSRNVEAKKDLVAFEIELYVLGKHKEKYSSAFGTPIYYLGDALRFKKKYYGIWYKRLWYGCARLFGNDLLEKRYRRDKLRSR